MRPRERRQRQGHNVGMRFQSRVHPAICPPCREPPGFVCRIRRQTRHGSPIWNLHSACRKLCRHWGDAHLPPLSPRATFPPQLDGATVFPLIATDVASLRMRHHTSATAVRRKRRCHWTVLCAASPSELWYASEGTSMPPRPLRRQGAGVEVLRNGRANEADWRRAIHGGYHNCRLAGCTRHSALPPC